MVEKKIRYFYDARNELGIDEKTDQDGGWFSVFL